MTNKAAKIHIGLINQDKALEASLREALEQMGGGYVHSARSMLELHQKMTLQKIDVIVYAIAQGEDGAQAQALVGFFRGKRDTSEIPICIMVAPLRVEMNRFLNDPLTRGFSLQGGPFLALVTMLPLIEKTALVEFFEPLSIDWIKTEFLTSLQTKVGQASQFTVATATDDDLHASFFCQTSDEVRSHLGWFKFAARFQDSAGNGMKGLFPGMTPEFVEQMAEVLLSSIVTEFKEIVEGDLQSRGAIFYPSIDQMSPADRKLVYAGSRSSGLIFTSESCSVLLEVIQYI